MDAKELGKKLYDEQGNRVHPSWDQLQPGGACQSLWIERARLWLERSQALQERAILDTYNDFVEAGRLL